jgi:hypothetical protein
VLTDDDLLTVNAWTGSLALGDYWDVVIREQGIHYTPVSDNFESVTLFLFYEGILHRMYGAVGTVSFSGESGAYGKASFTFTGDYVDPIDYPIPTNPVFEATIPSQIEYAGLCLDGYADLCAQSFSVDIGNTITPRACISGRDGFNGRRITARNPQGSVNPEAVKESVFPFWRYMANGNIFSFHVKAGSVAGNQVKFISDSAQIGALNYGDRDGFRTYDVPLRFSQYTTAGNDEIRIVFA